MTKILSKVAIWITESCLLEIGCLLQKRNKRNKQRYGDYQQWG